MNEATTCLIGAGAYGLYVMGCVYLVDTWWQFSDWYLKLCEHAEQVRRDNTFQLSTKDLLKETGV